MDAYPMLARCAARQLSEDAPMYAHLLDQHEAAELIRPNLLLETGPARTWGGDRRDEHGTLVPMMVVKAG